MLRKIGEGNPRGEAGWLIGNSVGNMDGLKVLQGARRVGKTPADLVRCRIGKLFPREVAAVQNGGRNQMPTRRSEAGCDVCDLNKMAHPASCAFWQDEASLPVE